MLQDYSGAQKTGLGVDWLEVFDKYRVQFVALDRHSDGELLSRLHVQPGWKIDFDDGENVIFARANDPGAVERDNQTSCGIMGIAQP